MVGIAHPNKLNCYLDGGKIKIMFSWFTRPIIYIRIKPDWVNNFHQAILEDIKQLQKE